MIVDRYHLSLSKMRPNMSLTVTIETEPSEHAQSSHADPVPDPAKVNFIPRAHVSFGHHLVADQKTHGLWERDSVKVVRKYVCGKRICLIFIRWPKRVKHKSVYQNTKQFPKTQINFPKHKSVYQNTNQFPKTRISLPNQKTIS